MAWVPFERAEQAKPGVKMRRLHRAPVSGRPREVEVLLRERDRLLGNIIRFTDGSYISIYDAKGEYEVNE